jgi:hypothetical protein
MGNDAVNSDKTRPGRHKCATEEGRLIVRRGEKKDNGALYARFPAGRSGADSILWDILTPAKRPYA